MSMVPYAETTGEFTGRICLFYTNLSPWRPSRAVGKFVWKKEKTTLSRVEDSFHIQRFVPYRSLTVVLQSP